MKSRYTIKNILFTTLWIAVGAGVVVLLVAAIRKKDAQHCIGIEINIRGVNNNFFVDKSDILNSITAIAGGNPVGRSIGSFNLKAMEKELRKNTWVRSAEMFFDNNAILEVRVDEREPVARIFTSAGTTFYIDNDGAVLPLSEKFSARLPVFTNFPSGSGSLLKADSNLLNDIKMVSLAIQKDSFRMAMIEQVEITSQRTFEMIPKIGNQVIVFGDASAAEDKFNKLQLFYKEVMVKAGWNYYSIINLQYANQVVAKRRGAEDITADSMRTLQIMHMIATSAEKQANDSLQTMLQETEHAVTDSSMVQQSIERDDNIEPTNIPAPVQKTDAVMQGKKVSPVKKSKITMPKKK